MGGIGGAIVDVGAKYLGNELIGKPNSAYAYKQSEKAAKNAFDRSYGAYKTRYQDTMEDMRIAGLNPILAAGSGGFNVGNSAQMSSYSGFQPQVPDVTATSSAKNLADVGHKKAQKKKTLQEAKTELIRAAKMRAEKGLINQQEKIAVKTVLKIVEETKLLLNKQMESESKTGLTEQQHRLILKQIKKLKLSLNELERTSKIYGAPAGHIMKVFELIIKSLTPKLISLGAE